MSVGESVAALAGELRKLSADNTFLRAENQRLQGALTALQKQVQMQQIIPLHPIGGDTNLRALADLSVALEDLRERVLEEIDELRDELKLIRKDR